MNNNECCPAVASNPSDTGVNGMSVAVENVPALVESRKIE